MLDGEVFGDAGFVYDCGVWLRLFSSSCLYETATRISAKSASKANKMLENEPKYLMQQTPVEMLCFVSKANKHHGSIEFNIFQIVIVVFFLMRNCRTESFVLSVAEGCKDEK